MQKEVVKFVLAIVLCACFFRQVLRRRTITGWILGKPATHGIMRRQLGEFDVCRDTCFSNHW